MYVVRVVLRDANEYYLCRGGITRNIQYATWYPHPSNARARVAGYVKKHGVGNAIIDILDPKDPERRVEL
jgi:hypothetical protein